MELPKASFDELPSPTSDLAWSPSPSKQRLPALSPHLSLPSPHRRGSLTEPAAPQRRRARAGTGRARRPGRARGRAPLARERRQRQPRQEEEAPSEEEAPPQPESRAFANQGKCPGRHSCKEEGLRGGRRKIDKKSRRKHRGRKQYARLDEYAQQQEAQAPGPAPSLVKSRPETPADVAPEESDGSSEDELEVEDDGIQGVPSLANPCTSESPWLMVCSPERELRLRGWPSMPSINTVL